MKSKLIAIMFIILLLLLAAIGGLFLVRPILTDLQRQESEEKLLEQIEKGETHIPNFSAPSVEGEALEFEEMEPETVQEELETVEITGYGVISIPEIDLKMPLVKGVDKYSLRAAAGWYPESAQMGSAGNCVIFGHRMETYGRHFNRLGELKAGHTITLYNTNGEKFEYTVTGTEVIDPGILMDTLLKHNEGFGLTLVTCTPTGVGSHRLLVYGQMVIPEGKGEIEK